MFFNAINGNKTNTILFNKTLKMLECKEFVDSVYLFTAELQITEFLCCGSVLIFFWTFKWNLVFSEKTWCDTLVVTPHHHVHRSLTHLTRLLTETVNHAVNTKQSIDKIYLVFDNHIRFKFWNFVICMIVKKYIE